jgi:transposase-like protein
MSQHQPNRNGQLKAEVPDPEVAPRAKRRQFSAKYKLRILTEAEQCSQRGEIGALLRREGLYSSHLTTWRKQGDRGQLQGLAPKKRGRKPDPQAVELAQLQRENERLKARLAQAETIIEVQKKLSQMLGLPPAGRDENE